MKLLNSQQGHSMEGLFPLAFVAFLVAVVFRIMLRSRAQVPIKSPTLGFLNLGGDEFLPLIDTDRAALAPIFSEVKTGAGYQIPNCDILFIYANVTPDGSVGIDINLTVRHLAERAGAAITVVASGNSSENVLAAARLAGPKQTNLVWTLDRKGEAFPRFFVQLFTHMKKGRSMPAAWVAISPQVPSRMQQDQNLPDMICNLEAGQVRFQRAG
jgi:hypothetical protein